MALGAGLIEAGAWMQVAFAIVLATVVASVGHYAWLLARKFSAETGARATNATAGTDPRPPPDRVA